MPSARRLACTLSEKTGIFAENLPQPYKVDSNTLQRLLNVRLFLHFLTLDFLSRYIVLPKDFEAGYKNNIKKDESEHEFYK